jgi:hypothetical protein
MQLITAGSLAIAQLTKMGTNHDRNIDRIGKYLGYFLFLQSLYLKALVS